MRDLIKRARRIRVIKVVVIILFMPRIRLGWRHRGHPGPGPTNFRSGLPRRLQRVLQTFAYAFYSYGGVECWRVEPCPNGVTLAIQW